MSAGSNIPWNTKPKNGLTTFFTEKTFNKWLCPDTHESRLEERLTKLGIIPPPRLTGPILLHHQTSANDPRDRETIKCKIEPCNVKPKKSATVTGTDDHNASLRTEAEIKSEVQTYSSLSEFSSSQAFKYSNKPSKHIEAIATASLDTGKNESNIIVQSGTDITKVKEDLEHKNDNIDDTEVSVEQIKETQNAISPGEHFGEESERIIETVADNVRPFSFYKEGTEEDYKAEESDEDDGTEAATSNYTETASSSLQTDVATEKEDVEVELSEEQLKELEAQREEEARKVQADLMRNDKMFFNLKDRQATKYFPVVYKRKPRDRRSQLTCQEQKLYNDLARSYGKMSDNSKEILDDKFKKYIAMKVIVNKEQELFQKYLRSVSFSCKKDYAYIHPEVEKYATTRHMVKKQDCFKYPRFYSLVDCRIILTDDLPNTPPTLQYVRPLLELGTVSKLVLPNIVHGMPQPCVTTNFNKINEISPILKAVYKGTSVPVWNKVMCSQDANAEQLAVPNKCDVVMSSSAIRRLIDNQGKIFKYWDMPFTVREYNIKEGEKTIIHKVVYIDKPFIRQSQFVPKDHIQLYQKHAIRALAIRTNVRGRVFCGIKPVHELVKLPTLDEVEREINLHEEKIKETVNKDDDYFQDAGENLGHADTKKRKRKHGQGGMFDLEKDIDDLETFGMDSFIGERSKVNVDGNKNLPDGKINMCTKEIEVCNKHAKKGRKSADDDLEFLKNELMGIKTQAIKESAKHLEMYKDSNSKGDKIDTEHFEMQQTSKDCGDGMKSHESTVGQTDNGCASNQNNGENTDLKHDEGEMTTVMEDCDRQKESEQKVDDVSNKEGKIPRKTKKDILTVKNMSSFSKRLKQMSTIKSKLMHRSKGADDADHVVMSRTRSRSKSLETIETSLNIGPKTVISNPDNDNENIKTQQKLSENAFDSDSEGEGLVIDVPSESPQQSRIKDMPKSPEMPNLERISDIPMREENQPVSSESEFGSPHLVIAIDDVEEAEDKTKGKKRRSTDDFADNVTVPKRILRSSLSQESSDSSKAGNQSLESGKDEPKRKGMDEVLNARPSLLRRGKKLENQSVSTRSRSASAENVVIEPETNSVNNRRRVTRRSTASCTKEESVTQAVPVKKGRGRPRKNATVSGINGVKDEVTKVPEDEPEKNLTIGEEKDNVINSELLNITEGIDSDNEKDISPTRNKTARRIDSDDESSNSSREKHEKTGHNKQGSSSKKTESKKELTNLEARKIKEMAAAMKKKISEAKNKKENEKTLKKEEGEENKKDEEGKFEPDKAVTIVKDMKADSKDHEPLKQESSTSTILDKGLDNILKLQDKSRGTGTVRGSAVDVFKQKHGLSCCEFPVEGNVTYHQWKLGETNLLIRCKYHGYISGQGLVHIAPKIEYQPNFGFEQDTVSDICKNWISIYVRPNSTLLKPRINPYNSEIMMFENIAYNDLIPPDSLFKPEQAFTDLQVILEKLKSLPVGQYLLKNNPRKDQFTVLKATDHGERGSFDLHFNNSSIMKCTAPSPLQWTPINPNLMLPHQRKMNFIPCTFLPKDAQASEKKPRPAQLKKKKKKRNNDN